jgi:YVTN family beta-propeller protein/VCBS repeat-containing protein
VRVSDGQTFTDMPVTVVVRPGQLAGGTPVDVDRDPSAVAVNTNGSLAYVTNKYDKTVSVIDTSTGAVVATIKVPYSPTAVVVNPGANQYSAYVAMTTGVAVIDTANNKVVDLNTGTATIDVIKVGSSPSAIAINSTGTRLYVSNGGSSTVSVINTATNTEITKVTVGSQPSGLAVSSDDSRVYALSLYSDKVTVIRTSDNRVIGSAAVGDSPRGIVLSPNGQVAYVTNYNSGTVTVLNTVETTPAFVKTITVGTQPEGIAISKDGALVYVANGRDTVSAIDTRSNTVIGSAVPIDSPAESGAHAIAVSGNKIYVTDYVDGFVRVLNVGRVQTAPQANGAPTVGTPNPNTGTIVGDLKVIDTDGDALSYTVFDAPDQGALTVDPNGTDTYTPTAAARVAAGANTVDTFTVRVSDSLGASKDVSVTVPISPAPLPPNRAPYANATGWGTEGDLATGVITGNMNGVDPDGDPLTYAVWSPSRSGTVTVNPTTGEFTYIPTLAARLKADTTAGTDYDAISISVSDGRATTNYSMPVYVAPARAGLASPIAVGQDPTGVAVGGNQVFVLNQTDKTMSVISPTSNSTIPFSSTPTAVAVSPDGSRAYVTLSGAPTSVAVIDTASKQIVKNVTVGSSPAGVAMSQDGRRMYVTNSGSGTVSVIDTDPTSATYNTELRRITVGTQPTGIAVAPDGRRLYVTRPGSGAVAVVDTLTNMVAANVTVGGSPRGVAITPDGRHAYVTNDDGTVSVIDTVNNFVVNRIAVGPSPLGVAIGRDGTAYVANVDDTVSLIDTGKQSVFATFALSPQTATGSHYVAVNADGTRIYVTDTRDDTLRGLTITRGNTAPEINPYVPVVVGTPNTTNGAVTGSVNATDPEVDRLTYTASAPANGIVTIDAATGNFTYTPSQAARDYALTTEQNDIDTFTITVSDGQATANTIVSVPVMATNNVAPEWQNQTNNYDPVTRTTTGTVIARDADGDTLRYYLVGSSYAGSATVTEDGRYVYIPFYTGPNGYWNYDYIPVAITDGHYTTYAWIYVDTYTEYCGEACAL